MYYATEKCMILQKSLWHYSKLLQLHVLHYKTRVKLILLVFPLFLLASESNQIKTKFDFFISNFALAFITTRKIAALQVTFSSSCEGLQPLAAMVGPFGSNNRALRAHLKMFKIHLENFAEIHLKILYPKVPKSTKK